MGENGFGGTCTGRKSPTSSWGEGLFLLGRCDCCLSRIWLRLKFDSEAFEGHIRSDLSG